MRLRPHPSVMTRELGGETVLLNLETGVYYGLNAVGTRAWTLLAESRTVREVSAVMAEEYDVSPEVLDRDLAALADDLYRNQLVVEVPEPPS